ncbi:Phosphoribosylformylglycinamidine synthase subunit PurL [bioreactor metagenome]|uniref:Phosphoribosylformylglycinamidine synthase subunit PurL n=1 Tax=bioreactor metagenome TaxID=1076179 RepID=A0A645HAV8_9ZZZZ
MHGRKTGIPPRCDLEKEKELNRCLLGLIQSGSIKSAHDCSEGGMAVTLAESCISQQIARETPRLIGAKVDLSSVTCERLDALLFGESQARIVISTSNLDAVKVIERAKLMGIPAMRIGTVGGDKLEIKTASSTLSSSLIELHDAWWHSIARAMKD